MTTIKTREVTKANDDPADEIVYRLDGARKVPPKVVFLILEYYFLFVICTIPT